MRLGLRSKFLILISVLLVGIVAVVTTYLVRSSVNNLSRNLDSESVAFATLATTPIGDDFLVYKDSGTNHITEQFKKFLSLNKNVANIFIVDASGQVQFSSNAMAAAPIDNDVAGSFDPTYANDGSHGTISRIIYPYFEQSQAHRYSIVYDFSATAIQQQINKEARTVVYLSIAALAFTIAILYGVINAFILRPVRQVVTQALAISAGNLDQQIAVKGSDEIFKLGSAVNTMAESLKKSIAELKEVDKVKSEFMVIASHNLRTPLTVISGYTDSSNSYETVEDYKQAMEGITLSAKRLHAYAEDMLTISRFELGADKIMHEEKNFTELVKDISDDAKLICQHQKKQYHSAIDDKERLVGISEAHVRSAIWNILDNALKFTKENGEISIKLEDDGHFAILSISDNGIGIKAAELPKLFTKFHRGTDLMTYDYEGTGIGLYSSKLIIEQHGGTITAASTEGQGSTFVIKLPLIDSHPKT